MDYVQPVTVRQLVAHLGTFDPDLPVAYRCCSEYTLLELQEIRVGEQQPARADGWIHDEWGKTPPLPKVKYLIFPGN